MVRAGATTTTSNRGRERDSANCSASRREGGSTSERGRIPRSFKRLITW